jgi:hypothetical protein
MYFVLGEGSIYIAQNVNRHLYIISLLCNGAPAFTDSCFKSVCYLVHSIELQILFVGGL